MRNIIRLAFALLLLCGLSASVRAQAAEQGAGQKAKKRPPNIIHFVADDVGYDDLSCFGSKLIETKNLDGMAKKGRKFTSFYAPHPYCTPTRAAIMTGCYAQRVGLPTVLFPNNKVGLHQNEITIGELLRRLGYRTTLIGKWHLGHLPQFLPPSVGFDEFFGIPYPNDHGPERAIIGKEPKVFRGFPFIPLIRDLKSVEQPAHLGSLPERFAAEARRFIRTNKDRPFFMHYSNIESHIPWLMTRQFMNKTKAGLYGDSVYCMDWQVGQILAELEAQGLTNDTLIVFQADNGRLRNSSTELEGIYGHAAAVDTEMPSVLKGGKGQSRYDGGVRVSCIAQWPGKVPADTVCQEMFAGFDLYTTFAKVAGGDVPKDRIIDGKDVRPLLFGEPGAKSPHSSLYFYDNQALVAVREGKWKLTLPGPVGPKKKGPGKMELYDLEADLGQEKNVVAAHPEIVQRLISIAEAARNDLGDTITKRQGKNRRPAGSAE